MADRSRMAERSRYFGQSDSGLRWPSVVVSLAITAASFASAFVAMRSLPDWTSEARSTNIEAPVVLRFPTPVDQAPAVKPPPIEKRDVRSNRADPATIPSSVAPAVAPLVAPLSTPLTMPSSAARADSSGVSAAAENSSGSPARIAAPARASGKGAPIAPAGIDLADRAANTPAVRDSILRERMSAIPGLARTHAPSGAERAELEGSQLLASALRQRVSTAGNSRDLVVLQGKGKDGVGAVGGPGIVSIDFPLFSSGPSPAQRRKNETLDADYQLRLRRLQDRAYLERDSLRADSIRADSLRRDSLARRSRAPIVPHQ
jgi:hypothetical protein